MELLELAWICAACPLAQINCVLQENSDEDFTYKTRIIDDVLEMVGGAENFVYKVNNPAVSVPSEDYFKSKTDPERFSFPHAFHGSK